MKNNFIALVYLRYINTSDAISVANVNSILFPFATLCSKFKNVKRSMFSYMKSIWNCRVIAMLT